MVTNRYIAGPNEKTAGSVMGDGEGYTWTGSGDDQMPTSNYYRKELLTFGNATLCEIVNCLPPGGRVQFNIGRQLKPGPKRKRINHYFSAGKCLMINRINSMTNIDLQEEITIILI